ncbi:DEAD/DEAH box helicase domain-containing protein [Pseudonocardia autotrophica]|uniref:DEAD/DEAH box helicase n=2 Tax=Pseudonocardia TaxID=1847 RepID=A0ABQ0RVU7_9PSEU|nr:putative ATP-dependent helicase Lhr [Pseudonocardia autotrophica]TDN75306.1 DEAD/DEAH box helicase domain-containing protein [Pseudonocardia autotrophica]BBF99252.1 DEAD/DEAH box helicase [Pseudonocardia autotrophica]GEC24798.1 DEAD/DEAH box helicase [Pseudonocardia saturnea]
MVEATGKRADGSRRGVELLRRVLTGSGVDPGRAEPVDPGRELPPGPGETDHDDPLRHVVRMPARPGSTADWPDWTPPGLRRAWAGRGVDRPWTHQAAGAELVRAGTDVVVATGTASGKSLLYQLPVLAGLAEDPRATALYLAPTKALAADQLRSLDGLAPDDVRPASFDGDTPMEERDWVRRHCRWMFSNPDMLHRSLLPRHGRWSNFLRRLRFVVVDECHTYRGVFGSHVALLLRRLLRLAARYGARPTIVLASATVAGPAEFGSRLTGREVVAVTEDGSPHAGRTVAFWEPPLLDEITGDNGAPVRRSAGAEAARMLGDLVLEEARTLAFVRSRRSAELTALGARRQVGEVAPELVERIAAYRGGYLPEERRALEVALMAGELLGVATTNALELGVDISGLDAVVLAGFPGTRASFWQQAGRAGRAADEALVVLVARDDPLDTYLVHHPQTLLGAPVEGCVLNPVNPYVLAPQLACAAAEMPLTTADVDEIFGGAPAAEVLDALVEEGVLRRRPHGWFWPDTGAAPSAQVDIRGSGLGQVAVVEAATGRMLGTVDGSSAPATVYPGAVYLHRGDSFVVDELDLDGGVALVHPEDPDWRTEPQSVSDVTVLATHSTRRSGPVQVCFGETTVTSQVVAYRRRTADGTVLDQTPLDLPPQSLDTRSVWYTVDPDALLAAGIDDGRLPGALHAAEHAAIGMLPLFAICDRWDIGGLSTALHPDTGLPTVFVHDGHPGGAGLAERGHEVLDHWLAATRSAVADCECRTGCPSCVQSPKCGNGNNPLDKAGAVQVLDLVLAALAGNGRGAVDGGGAVDGAAPGPR